MTAIEQVPEKEPEQIQHIAQLTVRQLEMRYPGEQRVLRGVHAKDHGCVTAKFVVREDLPDHLRVGVFEKPGREYAAFVRFSNAATLVLPDSEPGADGRPLEHGSRGMAIKVLGVDGPLLLHPHGTATQDFLMINQPVFAFANVEDYEVLSRVLVDHNDDARPFFSERLPAPGTMNPTPSEQRAMETAGIIARIRSASTASKPPAYQKPPASPVDNDYFSASPFLFGADRVMRFRVRALSRSLEEPNVTDPNYLRTGLIKRLRDKALGDVVFHFEVQLRSVESIQPESDIENASHAWPDTISFEHVATLTIPLQEFDAP